jgi:hypothetical protein
MMVQVLTNTITSKILSSTRRLLVQRLAYLLHEVEISDELKAGLHIQYSASTNHVSVERAATLGSVHRAH